MASYHFTVKTDRRPESPKMPATIVNPADHADYINREGKYRVVDQTREQEKANLVNTLSDPNATDTNKQTLSLLHKTQSGNILQKGNAIATSPDAKIESLYIALALAHKKFGEEISVSGSDKFKAQVIVAAVEMQLPIRFADQQIEQQRIKLQEGFEQGRRQQSGKTSATNNGRTTINKPNIKRIGHEAPPQRRHHLHNLSELNVVQYPQGTELLLPRDVSGNVVNQRPQEHNIMRRDLSRTRRVNAEKIADKILAQQRQVSAGDHADYINRSEAFAAKGGCVHKDNHLPKWADGSAKKFFEAANIYEDPKGTRYREIEFALPVELNLQQQIELINEFVNNHLGKDFYWALAVHEKEAVMGNGERNPHVHIMFSERKIDDIERTQERSPEIFFKKANRNNYEKGGPKKDPKWNGTDRVQNIHVMRKDFADIQNKILEKYGFDVTVDHRTLVAQREAALERGDLLLAQILDRKPEENVGVKNANQANNEKVIALQEYRQLKREHQQLLIAADVLQKSIIQDETNQAVDENINQANIVLDEIRSNNLQDAAELKKLSDDIIATAKELALVRNLVIWDAQALAMAKRAYMSESELKLELSAKIIKEEVLTLKRLDRELKNPNQWNQSALDEYTKTKQQINNRLKTLAQEEKELAQKLKTVNAKFLTKDFKVKLSKKQKEIINENQPTRQELTALQTKLDNLIAQSKSIIHNQIAQKVQFIDDKTNELLAKLLAEQTRLAAERTTLTQDQLLYANKPKPAFYKSDRPAWEQEGEQLAQRDEALRKAESEINNQITAIKQNVYNSRSYEQLQNKKDLTDIEKIQITAKEIYAILEPEILGIKTERTRIDNEIKKIENTVISEPRAQEIAKDKYVNGEFKTAREEQAEIKKEATRIEKAIEEMQKEKYKFTTMDKPKWFQNKVAYKEQENKVNSMAQAIEQRKTELVSRTRANEQKIAELEARCNTPEGQQQIGKIVFGILEKNKPIAEKYNDLLTKRSALNKEITELTKLMTAVQKQVQVDAKRKTGEPKYSIKSSGSSGAGGGGSSSPSTNAIAKLIAQALSGEAKIAAVVIRIDDDKELDLSMLTDEERKDAIEARQEEQAM